MLKIQKLLYPRGQGYFGFQVSGMIQRITEVLGLTEFSEKEVTGHLFGPQKRDRNGSYVVLTARFLGGILLFNKHLLIYGT